MYITRLKKKQSENAPYCTIPIMSHFGKGKSMETIKGSVSTRWEEGRKTNRQSTKKFQGN